MARQYRAADRGSNSYSPAAAAASLNIDQKLRRKRITNVTEETSALRGQKQDREGKLLRDLAI